MRAAASTARTIPRSRIDGDGVPRDKDALPDFKYVTTEPDMADTKIEAIVTGKVWKIEKQEGEHVDAGEAIMILESMKMEIPIESPAEGVVTKLSVAEGDSVNEGQIVALLAQAN